jgi:hypothetical protein
MKKDMRGWTCRVVRHVEDMILTSQCVESRSLACSFANERGPLLDTSRRSQPLGGLYMKVVILGATGGTGLEIVRQAIERGHSVTALVRSLEKLRGYAGFIRIKQRGPLNASELEEILEVRTPFCRRSDRESLSPKNTLLCCATSQRP